MCWLEEWILEELLWPQGGFSKLSVDVKAAVSNFFKPK